MKYPRLLSLAVLVFLAAPQSLFAAQSDSPFKRGIELLDAWRIAEAEQLAAAALRDNPKSAAALDFDARVKFYQGRYPEAVASMEKALAIDSNDQRRQALKLHTQLTQDVVKNRKRVRAPIL